MIYVITTGIWHYSFTPFCFLCGHMVTAGDIMGENGGGCLICPYCGNAHRLESSNHIKQNSTKNIDGKYLEGKRYNTKSTRTRFGGM